MKKIKIAIIGCGEFSQHFVPLFKLHPVVEQVWVCDIIAERAKEYSDRFDVGIFDSFEAAIADDTVNAVAIFTPRHTHGTMVVKALEAGKDVYSAVPMGISVEECKSIIDAVEHTGGIYMMGETCIYYPSSMYCGEAYRRGDFGNFVYGESQYFHDLSHFPQEFINNRPASGAPPFHYPTHSTAMILNAADTYATKVAAMGYVDKEENTPFAVGENYWDNVFSNEFCLMQLANGGIARVSECRRIGYKAPSSFVSGFYGTNGSYQFNNSQHLVTRLAEKGVELEEVSDYVNPAQMTENKNSDSFKQDVANHLYQWNNFAPIQYKEAQRLPESYKQNPDINGHMASHQLLIDDFCTAVSEGAMPYVNAWRAARFTIPGLIAHESAKQGGVLMDIPDFGEAPKV